MQPRPSEKVSDVGWEWHRLGGVFALRETPWAVFSLSLVRLMMFFIISFWFRRCSLLLHHMGRLYSHLSPRCLHARQDGLPSSHFLRRRRQVKQPVRERRCILVACCFAAFAALVVVPTIVDECFPAEDGAEEEDMDKCCTCTREVVEKAPATHQCGNMH